MPGKRKLLIVANGLRDHVGHYFETSVSLAEAAGRAGLQPVLGTHTDCRMDLLPAWLPSYPYFRTDYWMRQPAGADSGQTNTFEQARTSLVGLAEVAVRYSTPPLFYEVARLAAYCCLPRIVRRQHRGRLRSAVRKVSHRWRYVADAALVEQAAPWPEIVTSLNDPAERPRIMDALRRLAPLGARSELQSALMFKDDLLRFLAAGAAGRDDHVLLTTAHAREVLAVHLVAERLGEANSPTFHLEFRHPLFDGEPTPEAWEHSPTVAMQRACLSLHADWGISDRVQFYTDAERLASDYESICGLRFGVLPLPFRAELMAPSARRSHGPLSIAYVGEARDEKGFHWLPQLIDELKSEYLRPGRVTFLIQANVSCPEHNPHSVAALARLKTLPKDNVELLGLHEALSPSDYYRLLTRADVMLLPYLQGRYRACTSGILAETLAAGIPAVVPKRTWLADQLPSGGGESCDDFPSFVGAVKRVIDAYDGYRCAVEAARPAWLAKHSPDALVRVILRSAEHGPTAQPLLAAA